MRRPRPIFASGTILCLPKTSSNDGPIHPTHFACSPERQAKKRPLSLATQIAEAELARAVAEAELARA